jgi:hypothetical protein
MNKWLVIGSIAGVGTLLVVLMGKGSSSGAGNTTAAGTSINAALGSIQEQNLNLMGQLGSGINTLSTQATDYNTSELAAMSGMQSALSDQMNGIDSHITDVNNGLTQELGTIDGHVVANGQAVSTLGTSLATYYTNLINAGQSNTQALTNTINQNDTAIMNTVTDSGTSMNSMMAAIGRFLGWQFYQIPNRYQAYIPANLNPPGFT